MKASTKRLISIAVSIFLFIVALIVYTSFIKPAYGDIGEKRSELAAQQEVKEQLELAVEQVQKLLAEYQDIGLLQETISSILPTEQIVPQAIAQVTGLAENNFLSIQSLTLRQLAIKPSIDSKLIKGLGTLRFDIRLAGNYESLKTFLKQLESNIRLMDLVDLKIESVGVPGQNIFLYTIMVDTYYQTN
ncbi:MAG: type 4a pilus biogenesis protein PilO [Candidatus Paceibacterota bacterium]